MQEYREIQDLVRHNETNTDGDVYAEPDSNANHVYNSSSEEHVGSDSNTTQEYESGGDEPMG
jgi:hypothetical protein